MKHSIKYLILLTPSFTDDSDGVIITGGFEGRTGVTRVTLYDLDGFQADLPSMLEARGGHACASFLNVEKEMVNMATENKTTHSTCM